MKYFFKVLLALVICVGVVVAMYYHTTGKSPVNQNENQISLTTVTKQPATEKNSNRQHLASLKKENYQLYRSNRSIIVVHKGKEYQFDNWNATLFSQEKPNLYCADFDEDGEKELIIRVVDDFANSGENKKKTYCLYILDPTKDSNGNDSYNVILADKEDWASIFAEQIKLEVSQLKNCNKYVQFAMDVRSKSIKYDKETGIAKGKHKGYAKALSKNGKYLKVDQMNKINGVYTIDKDNKINVEVDIAVTYQDVSLKQRIGTLHFQLTLKDSKLFVTPKSMYFVANDEYRISNPESVADTPWSYTENNENKSAVTGSGVIDWLKINTSYDPTITTQPVEYSNNSTDIDNIASVTITQSYVQLVAKQGASFDQNVIKNGDYSVIINAGTDNEYDIAYTVEVNGNILKINFDKAYPQSEINDLSVNFGAK